MFTYTHYALFKSNSAFYNIMFESILTIRFFNGVRQAVPNRGTNIRNCFLSHVCFAKRIFKFRKVISCAYPSMWGKFKTFIQIIRASVTDKIVRYSIYAPTHSLVGKQFIDLKSS